MHRVHTFDNTFHECLKEQNTYGLLTQVKEFSKRTDIYVCENNHYQLIGGSCLVCGVSVMDIEVVEFCTKYNCSDCKGTYWHSDYYMP